MKCPHCKKAIIVPSHALNNADCYGKTVVTVVECCGHAIQLRPIRTYEVVKYFGEKTQDDWGKDFKKSEVAL